MEHVFEKENHYGYWHLRETNLRWEISELVDITITATSAGRIKETGRNPRRIQNNVKFRNKYNIGEENGKAQIILS